MSEAGKVNGRTKEGRTIKLAISLAGKLLGSEGLNQGASVETLFRQAVGREWERWERQSGRWTSWGRNEPLEFIALRRQVEYAVQNGITGNMLRAQAEDLAKSRLGFDQKVKSDLTG